MFSEKLIKIFTVIPLFVMSACAPVQIIDPLSMTAAECRTFGVEALGAPTGRVTSIINDVRPCQALSPWIALGCAVPAEKDKISSADWTVYTTGSSRDCVTQHEACHARFETSNHTVKYFIRQVQGVAFAACP